MGLGKILAGNLRNICVGHNVSFSGDVESWSPQLFQVSVSNVETGVSQSHKALN